MVLGGTLRALRRTTLSQAITVQRSGIGTVRRGMGAVQWRGWGVVGWSA
jgi:hypothetical protein